MSEPLRPMTRPERGRALLPAGLDATGGPLAEHIRRSWQRCGHLDRAPVDAAPLAGASLRERREMAARLLACALPELDALTEHASGNGCVVVLTDASGLILEEIGSPDFLPQAERVALTPGVEWTEARRGTNAIGTALAESTPVLVQGREHYLPQNAAIGCAAAPIFTATGNVAGVLDISGEAARVNRHALGLVRMAAQQIEHRLLLAGARGHLLRFHREQGLLGSPREALMVVEDGCITGANRVALALLGRRWDELLGQDVDAVLGKGWGGEFALGAQPPFAVRTERVERPAPRPASRPLSASGVLRPPSAADALAPLLDEALKVLDHGVPVLVTGETGSGKEVFARRLHAASRRAGGPFVAVNCAALPEALIEAELFGYEEGAYTGARRRGSPGRVREAEGGTLFLDEIADMPLLLQTRLLRVLEERKVQPLGGGAATAVDFQLICATHGNLPALAAHGAFRSDLLYRVAGYTVALPPLRDRADRHALIEKVLADVGAAARGVRLDDEALVLLAAQPWPGNVRELASTLRGLVALAAAGEAVTAARVTAHLRLAEPELRAPAVAEHPAATARPPGPAPVAPAAPQGATTVSRLEDLERHAIDQALEACGHSVADAARRLGVHRSTVYRHLARRAPTPTPTPTPATQP
ncbi:Transcriptional regulator of acetoin/glycerol metabolism [Rubrivivax sp. A210]|uniref:sigma-54-dependent Fis family transcriptional regulator n=1 Tax=Rubrivivax sp. A210 TaxID=2772301 RepID=UPI0019CC338E|nr:sigma-54-dependent Fis family transcriptional regulator [Rubrivivax sp. A210]CAD5372991.1 Transcriptional regulator of acetoin/glycerol metabolism [Rubrivivax sp. A210]